MLVRDVNFMRELLRLDEQVLMTALLRFVNDKHLNDVEQVARMFAQDGPTFTFNENLAFEHRAGPGSTPNARDLSYAHLFAQALSTSGTHRDPLQQRLEQMESGLADIDYAMPQSPELDEQQQRIFDLVLQAFERGDARQSTQTPTQPITEFLTECVQVTNDPRVVKRLLDLGADPAGKGPVREALGQSAGNLPAVALALARGHAQSFLALANAESDDVRQQLYSLLMGVETPAESRHNAAPALASMMVCQGRNFAGLRCVDAMERRTRLGSDDVCHFRAHVLANYLLGSARQRVGWDPVQVNWLLGLERDNQALPEMSRHVSPALFAKHFHDGYLPLLTVALQTHCHPVLQVFQDKLRRLHDDRTLAPPLDLDTTKSGTKKKRSRRNDDEERVELERTGLTAMGLMMRPVNKDQSVNRENFEATLACIRYLKLDQLEREGGILPYPALHCVARFMGVDRGLVLSRLMELGFPANLTDDKGRLAESYLSRGEPRDTWCSVVRSTQARMAAHEAIAAIGHDERSSPQP